MNKNRHIQKNDKKQKSTESNTKWYHRYAKSIIYGGIDGIVTTFAIISGTQGASFDGRTVVILGISNLVADGVSMAFGDFASTRADIQAKEENSNNIQIDKFANIKKEGNITKSIDHHSPVKNGITTFFSFILFGSFSLIPYVIKMFTYSSARFQSYVFMISCFVTAITFFLLGVVKSFIIHHNQRWFLNGLEILIVGSIAASFAYGLGYFVSKLV